VVPTTRFSRTLPPELISDVPTTIGATRRTAVARRTAIASSTVRSRGVPVMAFIGEKPPVWVRPGSTITRLVPSAENSRTT
jgi:hypothetical protein